jgi:hypothetical protein
MNSTNLEQIANALNSSGYHFTASQLWICGVIIAAGVRWLHVEIPIWVGVWRDIHGFGGLRRFVITGSSLPKS